jgi:hypothetical protein
MRRSGDVYYARTQDPIGLIHPIERREVVVERWINVRIDPPKDFGWRLDVYIGLKTLL